jgi:hypothetical protein
LGAICEGVQFGRAEIGAKASFGCCWRGAIGKGVQFARVQLARVDCIHKYFEKGI